MSSSTQCLDCKHYNGLATCDAFPDKIPQDIMSGEVDHAEPYPGDGGITFEALDVEAFPELIESVVTKLSEQGLLKGETGARMEWRTVTRGGKTFRQRFKVGRKEPEPDEVSEGKSEPTTNMIPENVESIKSLGDMNIQGGINRKFTNVVTFKDGSNGIYKTTDRMSTQGEMNVQKVQSILGWDIAPETVKNDFGNGEGSCQKFISGDKEIDYGQQMYGAGVKIEEKHYDDLAKIFLMDLIVGNDDRHVNNVKIDDNGRVWAIDNDTWAEMTEYSPDLDKDFLKCRMHNWMGGQDFVTFQGIIDKHVATIVEHRKDIMKHFVELAKYHDQYKADDEARFERNFKEKRYVEGMNEDQIAKAKQEYMDYTFKPATPLKICINRVRDNLDKISDYKGE